MLIGPDYAPIAVGSHDWENQFVDRLWTYSLDAVWAGLQTCYAALADRRAATLRRRADLGRRARRLGHDARLSRLRRRWRTADALPDLAQHQHRRGRRAAERRVRPQHPASVERRPPVPGHPERRGPRRPDRAPDHAGRLRPLAAHRREGARHRRRQRHVPDRHRHRQLRRAQCWPSSTNSPPRPASELRLADLLPTIRLAGEPAGDAHRSRARSCSTRPARLRPGIPMCPPEGDAGTGMVATNSVAPRTGNVSAGTSIFAMVVLEHELSRSAPRTGPGDHPGRGPGGDGALQQRRQRAQRLGRAVRRVRRGPRRRRRTPRRSSRRCSPPRWTVHPTAAG